MKRPTVTAFLIRPVKPSATIRKRKGANGSPCLSPLSGMNSSQGLPFTNTEIEADLMQPAIQVTHLLQKFKRDNMYSKKSQSTVSYAFSKSTLNTTVGFLEHLASWITSFATTTLSNMFLPPRKAD